EGPSVPATGAARLAATQPPAFVVEAIGTYLDTARLLGTRTAEIHLALAGNTADSAFAPESYSALDQRSRYQSMRNLTGRALRSLRATLPSLPAQVALDARALLHREDALLKRFEALAQRRIRVTRSRCHGDFHLGRVLHTGRDFVVPDFEGDRA